MTTPISQLSETIRARQTWKVLGDPAQPIVYPESSCVKCDAQVKSAIATAGWAPFHYDRGVDGIAEPWRVHMLTTETCRDIAANMPDWFDLKPSNKLPAMLSACGCVLLVSWLPQFRDIAGADEELAQVIKNEIDDEHLSATAALIQNLLLLLTADGLGTYWSSGGQLGSPEMFQRLGIGKQEKLAAAIFVEYSNGQGPVVERIPGKNRERRSELGRWFQVAMFV